MEVRDVRIEDSPRVQGWRRVRATVAYETGRTRAEEYWFETTPEHASALSTSGNAWLAALLPLGATTGEAVRVPLPVDRPLLENGRRLLAIWKAWYPELAIVDLEADEVDRQRPETAGARTAAFFSGGADSFFTVLRDRATAPPAERAPVQDLITVLGSDVSLDRPDAVARLHARHERVAEQLGMVSIPVATNIRRTRWRAAQWSYLGHGAALAAIGLVLERRLERVYIAGGGGYRGLHPWGSHSVTDPLFSTHGTAVVYDAVSWSRTEKLERLASSPLALGALRVCYLTRTDENCGVCNKCLRTMLVLELCQALDRCPMFPAEAIDLDTIARMDCSHFADFREFQDIRALAVVRGRPDVVSAIDRSVRRTRWRRRRGELKDLVRSFGWGRAESRVHRVIDPDEAE